jgi:2-haloacid dehalogenase
MMLKANAEHAGIADLFDELLSTQANGTYKPEPRAYEEIAFMPQVVCFS